MRRLLSPVLALTLAFAPALLSGCAGNSATETSPDAQADLASRLDATSSRALCDELGERLCADLGPEAITCAMVLEQMPGIEAEQCALMTREYDDVLAELRMVEAQLQPLSSEAMATIAGGPEVPSVGPPDAAVTVVTFADFQCPYCALAAEVNGELRAAYGDRVRFVSRQFPLRMHPDAHLAAQAVLAAHAQGKFWAYHDLLFAHQDALGRASLDAYAQQLGLDMEAFGAALDQGTYATDVDAEIAIGIGVYVSGTPTVFINEFRAPDATNLEALKAELESRLSPP